MTRRRNGKSNDHSRSPEVLATLERKKIELDPLLDAWEQQPGETARDYGLFCMYRDHGRIRTIAQIAGMTPFALSTIARMSRMKLWVERAGRWDAEQDRLNAIRLQDAREDMARRHVKIAGKLMDKALERLNTLNPDKISPHALILMIDAAAKIERAALGLEKGTVAAQTSVTVAATAATDEAGMTSMRVEVGVQHDRIMRTLDDMVSRMTPEQLAAGYEELTASAEETTRELDAALPAPTPPPGP
jgi:hypothetical protein